MLNRTRGYVANFRSAPAITVSFDAEQYTAAEGGTVATVTVRLSAAPTRAIDIAFTTTSTTGAAASDYTVPRSVSFAANDTEQTFTITAVDDAVDDDGETVTLTLDHLLPGGVSAGSPATATVTLTDNDPVTGAPSILGLSLTSDPGEGYATGEQIEATVQFDKTVAVTGEPQLELTVGSVTRQASYEGGAPRSRDVFLRGGRQRDRCGWGEHCGERAVAQQRYDPGQRQPGRGPDAQRARRRRETPRGWRRADAAGGGGG